MPSTITAYNTFVAGTLADADEANANFNNHRGTLLPIAESTATSLDDTYDLGTSTKRWSTIYSKKIITNIGQWQVGNIKQRYSYNNTVPVEQGWMLCDGRQVTIANYDAEHSSGSWTTYIGSSVGASPIANLYLPQLCNNYLPIGASATSEAGTSALSTFGLVSTNNNITIAAHSHTYSIDHIHNTLPSDAVPHNHGILDTSVHPVDSLYVGNRSYTSGLTTTSESAARTIDVLPASSKVQYYMRII